jgi:ribonuclease D
VIDVLALGSTLSALRELLEAPDIAKVMFASKNDLFITQNVLDCGISPIRDIAVAQKLLGLKVNLAAHLGIEKAEKDGFQRANWLLGYAVGDVELLLDIEADLRSRLVARRLADRYVETCEALPRENYRIDQYRQYENKFPGFHRLGPGEKDLARLVWIFRELVGEHFDCPVGYLISTKALPDIIYDGPDELASRLEEELNRSRRSGKRIGRDFVEEHLGMASRITGARMPGPGFRS